MPMPQQSMREKIWDLGPEPPKPPAAPEQPKGKDGDPDYELAKLHYVQALEGYKIDLQAYGRQRDEYQRFARENGGPIQIERWGVEVEEAMARDPNRYRRELPRGMKPGKAHFDNIERQRLRADEMEADRRRDPQFGGVVA